MARKLLVIPGMKAVAFVAVMLLGFNGLQAQSLQISDVPSRAVSAISASKPGIGVNWMAGPNNTFEAYFTSNGKRQVYVYNAAGLLQQKKIETGKAHLPPSVSNTADAAGEVRSAYRVMTRTKQKYYEVHVATPTTMDRMRFNTSGQSIGTTHIALANPDPEPAQVVASNPDPAPAPATTTAQEPATTATPEPTIAMRGANTTTTTTAVTTSTTTVETSAEINFEEDMIDDDIADLLDSDDTYNSRGEIEFEWEDEQIIDDTKWEDVIFDSDDEELFDDDGWQVPGDDGSYF